MSLCHEAIAYTMKILGDFLRVPVNSSLP